jgi:hypothetical protein|nr:MAG TPA: hypothetical protein [Caudoviricetes sp.]
MSRVNRSNAKNTRAIMKEVRLVNKTNIWRILGMAGMVVGFIGTVLQDYAEDKDLDARIDEAVNKKLAESKKSEGQ